MRLGFRFLLFLGFFTFLTMTCHIGGELMGRAIVKPPKMIDHEKEYVNNLIECSKEERLQNLIDRYEKYYHFNGSVLVSWKGQVICDKTMGYADFATKDPLTSQSHFQLASVSKQFTAMAIMMLKQRGLLDFDDEVRKYIPQWPYPGMTIRHLLTHTSGLSNYMYYVEHQWNSPVAPYNHEVVAMLIKNKTALNFVPGRYHAYCNTGYVVLAYIVEKVSGEFFADFLDENIFKPLGMKNTFAYSATINRKNQDKLSGL
jgi:CubicO group peptidase (beta-lactamase class C family)